MEKTLLKLAIILNCLVSRLIQNFARQVTMTVVIISECINKNEQNSYLHFRGVFCGIYIDQIRCDELKFKVHNEYIVWGSASLPISGSELYLKVERFQVI